MQTNPSMEYSKARRFVLYLLSRRNYPSPILRSKLKDKGASQEDAERILEECINNNYIDDEAWIESFIRQYGKKYGRYHLSQRLLSHGFSRDVVNHHINLYPEELELEKLQHLIATKYRSYDLSDTKQRHKLFQALQRKGFSSSLVYQAIQ